MSLGWRLALATAITLSAAPVARADPGDHYLQQNLVSDGSVAADHTGCQAGERLGNRVQSVRPGLDLRQRKRILDVYNGAGQAAGDSS